MLPPLLFRNIRSKLLENKYNHRGPGPRTAGRSTLLPARWGRGAVFGWLPEMTMRKHAQGDRVGQGEMPARRSGEGVSWSAGLRI